MKNHLIQGTFHSKNLEAINCELHSQQFIIIMTRLFNQLIYNSNNKNKKICFKTSSQIIINRILPMILFNEKLCYNSIFNILKIISKSLITIQPNRSFKRIKRFSSDKFYHAYKDKSL